MCNFSKNFAKTSKRWVVFYSSSDIRDLIEWAPTQLENTRLGLLVTSEAPFEAAYKFIQEWRESNRTKFTEGMRL